MNPAPDRDAWRGLDIVSPPQRLELRVAPADAVVGELPVLYAIDSEGLYHLLVPLPPQVDVAPDRRSAGVHISARELNEEGRTGRFLDVACKKHHLREVFIHLADEMVQELRTNPAQPVGTCLKTLNRWRELLGRETSPLVSEEALAGLFGELWHLRQIVSISAAGLDAWVGPAGARHDFARRSTALEVKTTKKIDEQRFDIHGIDQLSPPTDGMLYFAATAIEGCEQGGESVPELVSGLRQQGVDALTLMSKLAAIGYRTGDEQYYSTRRYQVVSARFYYVDEFFPRIIRNSFAGDGLPTRIVRLSYTIDIAGMEERALPGERVSEIYASLAGV
jgi:hypothetical protein